MRQQPPPDYQFRVIPIEKALLFRTTIRKNNPEGQALTLETIIPTPDGFVTMKKIKVGDKVFDENENICSVVAKSKIWLS